METNPACELPEVREELIGGKVTAMAPPMANHNAVAENIYSFFRQYLRGRKCRAFSDKWGLYLSKTEHYIPDMMVVCDREKIRPDGVHGAPDLVVEVISPSTGRYDRGHKKDVYERYGVQEYWIVEPVSRTVEQYLLEDGKYVIAGYYAVYPESMWQHMTEEEKAAVPKAVSCGLFEGLEVPLDEIFYDLIEESADGFPAFRQEE